jgi:HD-GYP domain-containing protein (c-di-GMP phosphodiesterase class II)
MTQETRSLHEDFLRTFYKLVYMAKIHQDNNQLLMECLDDFMQVIDRLFLDDDQITIQISRGNIYLQDEKLHYRREIESLMNNFLQYFEKRNLQGLRFSSFIQDASAKEFLSFSRTLNNTEQQEDPLNWLVEQLENQGLLWAEVVHEEDTLPVEQTDETDPQDQVQKRKEKARQCYFFALDSIKEVAQKISSQKKAGVRKSIRVVQNMVDLVMEDEKIALGLSTIHDYDDYTFTHSINVAMLSMCLGRRIGLSRTSMNRIGICGLFHDLGKLDVPIEIIKKPGKLSESEFEEIKKHTIYSVTKIIKLQAPHDLKAKILLPPFEHHLKYDLSGYPKANRKKSVSLFGRIISIADVFDAITSPRVYRDIAFTPDQALNMMLDGSGTEFDPILLKMFINMLGIYPIGSLLELDTGELALVMDTDKTFDDGARPMVVLLAENGNGGYTTVGVADLAERDAQSGAFLRNIVKSLHPSSRGIQPAEFLI